MDWSAIPWHQLKIWAYIALALFLVYRPPSGDRFRGLGSFIERHFGDSIGFYILHLGITLVILGDIYPRMNDIEQTGNSLILAGMVALKLTKVPAENTVQTLETKVTNVVEPAGATETAKPSS